MNSVAIAPAYVHASIKRRKNTWYSCRDGNWTDPYTWMSNAMSLNSNNYNYPGQAVPLPIFPAVGDDVYINHEVTVNGALNLTINNLRVSGSLLFDNTGVKTLNIKGDVQAVGTINLTSTQVVNFNVEGVNNYIVNFVSGTTSVFGYTRQGDQPIMVLNYRHLGIGGTANTQIKTLTGNTSISGNWLNLGSGSRFETGGFDITIGGTTSISNGAHIWSSTSFSNIIFIGKFLNAGFTTTAIFSGNPNIEFRDGFTIYNNNNGFGTGVKIFTTNNQSIVMQAVLLTVDEFTIVGGITVTNETGLFAGTGLSIAILNGTVPGSTFVNKGLIYFTTSTPPMVTGVFDFTTFSTNTVGYTFNGAFTIPHTSYFGLFVSGTGLKKVTGNTTVLGNFGQSGGDGIDLETYDLSVTGSSNIQKIIKSGAGNILFNGTAQITLIDFSGNPTVEFRNTLTFPALSSITNSGTGLWTFSTNNITWNVSYATLIISAPVLISGAITVTIPNGTSGVVIFNNTLNGNNAASKFDNRLGGIISSFVGYRNAIEPMLTGILETDAAANIFKYDGTTNQAVKGGAYRTIEFGGSGDKILQGDVTSTARSTTGAAVLVLNGYTITP